MSRIVILKTFYNPIEANIVRSRLLDAGIQCFLTDENTLTINPMYNQALGGVKLHVEDDDVAVAREILETENEVELEPAEHSAGICPNCKSNHVGYGLATKKRFNMITAIVSIFFTVYPFYSRKVFHCYNCGHEYR